MSLRKFAFATAFAVAFIPAISSAAVSTNCEVIIPYVVGKWTHLKACKDANTPWKRGLCIQACNRVCEETRTECNWSLQELTECYNGCQDGPKIISPSAALDSSDSALEEALGVTDAK